MRVGLLLGTAVVVREARALVIGGLASTIVILPSPLRLEARQVPLRLQDALHRALANNERLEAARSSLQSTEIRLAAAGAVFRPVITPMVSGAFGQTDLANQSYGLTGSQKLALGTEDAPLKGRAESCYTYTVIDTIGGGSSEIQRNIISKRKFDLPKNF